MKEERLLQNELQQPLCVLINPYRPIEVAHLARTALAVLALSALRRRICGALPHTLAGG